MRLDFVPLVQEIRQTLDLARYSDKAIENMYEYCAEKIARLELHTERLDCWLSMERDLFRLLQLAERRNRVEENIAALKRRLASLRRELLRRKLREAAQFCSGSFKPEAVRG